MLLSFRLYDNVPIDAGYTQFYDKVAAQVRGARRRAFRAEGVRVVPPAVVRRGAYIARNAVLMPSYVNIGAYVGEGTMVDTWATVGSCAQIGRNVHLSGGVGIGGVLEPLQANPTIIEDDCFIGARSEVVEGVIVEEGAVLSMGVYVGQSTRIYDRERDEVLYGRIPAGAVVVPGSLPAANGKYGLYARRDRQARRRADAREGRHQRAAARRRRAAMAGVRPRLRPILSEHVSTCSATFLAWSPTRSRPLSAKIVSIVGFRKRWSCSTYDITWRNAAANSASSSRSCASTLARSSRSIRRGAHGIAQHRDGQLGHVAQVTRHGDDGSWRRRRAAASGESRNLLRLVADPLEFAADAHERPAPGAGRWRPAAAGR